MSCHASVVTACVLSLGLGRAALAQSAVVVTTENRSAIVTGTVQRVSGNTLTVREASGLHAYSVRDGFKLRKGNEEVGLDQLTPGEPITIDITDQVTTQHLSDVRRVEGKVMQVTPGGFVLLDPKNQYVSYDFEDARGDDYHYRAPEGQEASLRSVEVGEHLSGEMVTRFPAQVIDERIVQLDVTSTPGLAAARKPPEGAPATGASR
jgi:hypothetical protein